MVNPIPKTANKSPNDFMKEKQAIENAKDVDNAKQPVDASKKPEAPNTTKSEDKAPVEAPKPSEAKDKPTKRKTAEEWDIILDELDSEAISIPEAAEKYNVTTSNIYQWRSKRKAKQAKAEAESLSANTLVDDAKILISNIEKELKEFDEGIEEAKAKVANAKEDRAKIEAKTKKYQAIIDMFEGEYKETKKNK